MSGKGNRKWKNSRPRFEQKRNFMPKREYRHQEQLKESEVGITEYINKSEGFTGVIKARFSDFHVNEINSDGKLGKLTDNSIPKDFCPKNERVDYKDVAVSPSEHIPQDTWDGIKGILESDKEMVNLLVENVSKEDRKTIYECIRTHFGQKIVATTVTVDNVKYMQFKKYTKGDKVDFRTQWPSDKGEWVHFLVYKEALDTLEACLKISDCLRMPPSAFSYAGVKDRRAKTTQWFCVRKVEPWKLIVKTRPLKNVKIGNFEFKNDALKIGDLAGNKFRIALRNVTADDDLIERSMHELKQHGFINYYGLQRFGNEKETPTFSIGVNLLQGKWKEAVSLILKPKKSDDPSQDVSRAKKIYFETNDAKKSLRVLDRNKNQCVEATLLRGLAKNNENDYFTALETIPRNMRLLYLHSFQSLIWNRMVSKRIEKFGLKPVEGDLVMVGCDDVVTSDDNYDEPDKEQKTKVKQLRGDEISNHTIYDIVLPLPGYDVTYPENLKQEYKEALEEYELSLEMPKQKARGYNLSGNYRKILEHVTDFSWKLMRYDDPTENLIRSDFEEMIGKEEPRSVDGGKYKALVMEFVLKPSSYATMILREIMKCDTSSSSQAKLNDYHEVNKQPKRILMEEECGGGNVTNDDEVIQNRTLLSDKEKYEIFKSCVFDGGAVKRKNEEEDDEKGEEVAKKVRCETQPSDD